MEKVTNYSLHLDRGMGVEAKPIRPSCALAESLIWPRVLAPEGDAGGGSGALSPKGPEQSLGGDSLLGRDPTRHHTKLTPAPEPRRPAHIIALGGKNTSCVSIPPSSEPLRS